MAITVKPSSELCLSLRLGSRLAAEDPTAFGEKMGYDGEKRFYLLPGKTYFENRVFGFVKHTVRVMSDEWADETVVHVAFPDGSSEEVNLGYSGDGTFNLDAATEVHEKTKAYAALLSRLENEANAAEQSVEWLTPCVRKGRPALVFKGRKILPGTTVQVFWTATRQNTFNGQMEDVAGVITPDGKKVFCNAGNLQPLPEKADLDRLAEAQRKSVKATKDYQDALAGRYKPEPTPVVADQFAALRAAMPASIIAREAIRSAYGDQLADELYERQEVQVGE